MDKLWVTRYKQSAFVKKSSINVINKESSSQWKLKIFLPLSRIDHRSFISPPFTIIHPPHSYIYYPNISRITMIMDILNLNHYKRCLLMNILFYFIVHRTCQPLDICNSLPYESAVWVQYFETNTGTSQGIST